jgi:2-isopropylmalate synthase
LGKHSGRHALANRYAELGHTVSNEELELAYRRFSQIADRRKNIYDQDLLSLLQEIRGREQPLASAATAQA